MTGQVKDNPILVEVTRGIMVESRHRGAVAVVSDGGDLMLSAGDIRRLVYPRSAVKPFQAMVAVESGAFEAFDLGDAKKARDKTIVLLSTVEKIIEDRAKAETK